jgi:hypothetical protein
MRAMLGKLEDRLQNMESIDSLPHEKQERIAKETRDVFVPMAYALRLFKLCDALTTHVVKVLDPDTYLRIIALQTASEKKLDKIRKGNTGKNILNAQLDALPYIKVLREDYRPHVELSVPGFYELMQILREEGELPQQKINMKVILPEFSDTRTDDFVFESLYCFESVKRLFEFKVKHDIGMDRVADVLRTGKKRLHATTEVDGIEIGMEFVAKLQDEKDTSSIAHRFTPHWQRSDRARYAMQHVLYLREKYMDAKRSGTVYTFWGPLAEELRNSL